jgi:hypothetical protein
MLLSRNSCESLKKIRTASPSVMQFSLRGLLALRSRPKQRLDELIAGRFVGSAKAEGFMLATTSAPMNPVEETVGVPRGMCTVFPGRFTPRL